MLYPHRRLRGRPALLALALLFCAAAQAQQPVGEVLASDATVKGSVVLASSGTQVLSGSSVTAGTAPASLRLTRGGEVRVCPGTSVSVSASSSGRELMLGLSAGALETHYKLAASADSIVTPDFRLLLAGPGTFHFAVSSDAGGNACVRSLENDTASIIVSELLGDGTYQVRPGQTVFFHNGRVSDSSDVGQPCGCPAPQTLKAEVPPAPPVGAAPTAALPQLKPGDLQVMVEAPFVFRAEDLPGPAPSPVIAQLRLTRLPRPELPPPAVRPPPKPADEAQAQPVASKPARKGFFARVSAFFAGIFR